MGSEHPRPPGGHGAGRGVSEAEWGLSQGGEGMPWRMCPTEPCSRYGGTSSTRGQLCTGGGGRPQEMHLGGPSHHILKGTAPPRCQLWPQSPEFRRGEEMPSQARRAIRVLQKEPLSVRRPRAPPLLAFQSLDSARWTPDGTRTGGRQPGLDLALSQAPELTASPCCPRAPGRSQPRTPSAPVWAVGAG